MAISLKPNSKELAFIPDRGLDLYSGHMKIATNSFWDLVNRFIKFSDKLLIKINELLNSFGFIL